MSKRAFVFFLLFFAGLVQARGDSDFPSHFQVQFSPEQGETPGVLGAIDLKDFEVIQEKCKPALGDEHRILDGQHRFLGSKKIYLTLGAQSYELEAEVGLGYGHVLKFADCKRGKDQLENAVLYFVNPRLPFYKITVAFDFNRRIVQVTSSQGHQGIGQF